MSIRVQATSDLVRTESTARVISDPASLQRFPVERTQTWNSCGKKKR